MLVSRPSIGGAFLAMTIGLGLTGTSHSTPLTYSFEGLAAGTVVTGQLPGGEILPGDVYSAFDITVEAVNVPSALTIFDTASPTGGDFDLGTPNEDFGGPGRGDGGSAGMPGENKTAQGKVLVIPQNLTDVNHDGRVDAPNDNHEGGVITIDWPEMGLMNSMMFIDIEEDGAFVDMYAGDQLVQSFPIPALGDNAQIKVTTLTNELVDRSVITFPGSGALASMTFDPIGCLPPECNVAGVMTACAGTLHPFTTTVGAEFTRVWSTSGPCSIEGPNGGSSVDVRFNGAGACSVFLTVTDPENPDCPSVCSQAVSVVPLPPCDIAGPEQVCPGATRTFSTGAGDGFARSWSASSNPPGICSIDGPTDGGSISVNFTGTGQCTLSLTVTDPVDPEVCHSECELIVSVVELPSCDITGDFDVCVGNSKTYSTTSGQGLNRLWSVTSTPAGICNTVGLLTGASVQLNFTGAGECTLSLEISDPADPENCSTTCTQIVTVNEQPPCDISGPSTACVGNRRMFSTTVTGYDLKWSAVSNPPDICDIADADNGSSVTLDFSGTGVCTLSLTVGDPSDPEDCTTVCSHVITVNPQPSCDFTGDLNACIGNSRTYTATAGAGHSYEWSATSNPPGIFAIPGSATGSSVTLDFTGAGACTLSLTVRDTNDPENCASTCQQVITIAAQPPCDISGDEIQCAGTAGTYSTSAAAGFTKSWSATSTPPGICAIDGPADGSSVNLNFTGAGTCTLSLLVFDPADPENCRSTCSLEITVNPRPPCDVSGPDPVCAGVTKTYSTTVGAEFSRQWSVSSTPGGIAAIDGPSTGSSVDVDFTGAGSCTVSLTVRDPNDPENCATVCEKIVTVNPLPPCDITGEELRCIGSRGTYSTTAGAGFTKSWSVTSTPPGIAAIDGPADGSSVDVSFTGAGACTLSLTVIDPNDPENCRSTCDLIVTVAAKPPCDISGAEATCVGAVKTYSTSLGAGYSRQWSVSSTPAGIAAIVGPSTGSSVDVSFTGAGSCTVSLAVMDPTNPENCETSCDRIVTISGDPTCNITGDSETCIGDSEVYASNAGAGLTKSWSILSTPPGIAAIQGSTTGSSVTVNFTGAGDCTLRLIVTDPADPDACGGQCEFSISAADCTPEPEPGACWMTGGGCLNDGIHDGHKDHSFGGNVGPQPSGSWEHLVRQGNRIEFNFHSWDAMSDSCWKDDGEGPCSPAADNNNILFSGTGLYSDGNGHRDEPATFTAHVQDRGESGHGPGQCGGKDYYKIFVYDLSGGVVFHAEGELSCGNLQIHQDKREAAQDIIPTPSGPAVTIAVAPAAPNPFQSTTRVSYSVRNESGAPVTVTVFDVSGRQIRRLVDQFEVSGDHVTTWDGRTDDGETVTGGIYFIRVASADAQAITRVLFSR